MRKSAPRRALTKSTLLSAACMSAACASAPTPRPVLPTECPPGSEETLRRFNVIETYAFNVILWPIEEYNSTEPRTVKEGPWTATVLQPWGDIMMRSTLEGVLYLEGDRLHGRFTRLRPRGMSEDFPICLQMKGLRPKGLGQWGQPLEPESRRGKIIVYGKVFMTPVRSFK